MITYLGYFDIRSTQSYNYKYYNFYPLYEIAEGKITPIENAKERFPEYGNYNAFGYLGFDFEEYFRNKEFCIIQLEDEDIQENRNGRGELKSTNYCINFEDLLEQGKIHKLGEGEFKIYPIVHAINFEVDFFEPRIEIMETFPVHQYMTESILFYKGKFYGPFDTYCRETDRKNYIIPKLAENNYLLHEYSLTDHEREAYLSCKLNGDQMQDFLCLNEGVSENVLDQLTDEMLLNQFAASLKNDGNTNMEAIKSGLTAFKNSKLITVSEAPLIAKRRIHKIQTMLADIERVEECYSETASIIDGLFSTTNNKETLANVLDELMNKKDFLDKIQDFRIVRNKIKEESDQLEILKEQIENAQSELAEKQKEIHEISTKVIDEKQDELNEINAKITEKQAKLDELNQKYQLSEDVVQLKKDHEYYERQNDEIRVKIAEWQKHIDEKIKAANDSASASKDMFDDYFNQLVSKNLSQYTAINGKNNEEAKYRSVAKQLEAIPTYDFNKQELIDYLIDKVKQYRPAYDRNAILNLFICMTQNFLTIFSGNPGTGKTSICNIIAHVLHLDHITSETADCFVNRYVPISVERGWNSKRELIGYYNPLSKKIEKSNSDFYDALRILSVEKENSKLPMLVLLDEANLSPMEYYWADFNNICDQDSNHDVNLGNDEHLYIPNSLRFFATINNDHTTEMISPRIIDRAFIVSLPAYKGSAVSGMDLHDDFDMKQISWKALKDCFHAGDQKIQKEPSDILNEICDRFAAMYQEVSPRSRKAVETYCAVAQNVFERVQNADPSIVALDYAVAQKIITKVSGNGDSYRDFLIQLNEFCKSKNLNMTSYQLDKIILAGDQALKYYQYFC